MCLNKISQVKLLAKPFKGFLPELVDSQKQLQATAAVFDVGEGQLTHRPHRAHAPAYCHRDRLSVTCNLSRLKQADCLNTGVANLRTGRVWLPSLSTHPFNFIHSNLFQV